MSPNKPRTPNRTMRIADEIWFAASEKAKREGTDVSTVVRNYLERWSKR